MAGGREIELKLEVAPGDVAKLEAHPRVQSLTRGESSRRRLHSVYFDTADLALAGAGAALRVRRVGDSWVQTLKTGSGQTAGLFERVEVEADVPDDTPRLDRIYDPELRAWLEERIAGRPLEPVITTDFVRTTRQLEVGASEVCFDLDVGRIRTPQGNEPICELELELREGEPGALYDLALELQRSIDLAPGRISKAARGYALLSGERPAPRKARAVELAPGTSLDDAIAAIATSCLEQIVANEAPAWEGVDPEGVHQMRVGVRRLRSALSILRDAVCEEDAEPLREELRWLADLLGGPRDWDVFLAETLSPLLERRPEDEGLRALHRAADELRYESYEALRAELGDRRYRRLLLELGRFCATRLWRRGGSARLGRPVQEETEALLGRRDRRVRSQGRSIEQLPPDELHRLRVRMKKLRYAAEFLRGAHPGSGAGRYARRAADVQDALGALNDVATAERRLAEILERLGADVTPATRRASGFVAGWIAHEAGVEQAGLRKRWKGFDDTPPFWH